MEKTRTVEQTRVSYKISSMANSRKNEANREIEENILAILDPTGFKDSKDDHDDRLAFLEAVRVACIVPESAAPPTKKMREAILEILRSSSSMELIVGSFQLLIELDESFSQVCVSLDVEGSTSSSNAPGEVVVVNEAWSPFVLGSDIVSSKGTAANQDACAPLDSSGFYLLVEDLAELDADTDSVKATTLKSLGKMFLLQYLVNALEQDFLFRSRKFRDTTNWILLRESLLNKLLGSRRLSYKGFVKNCVSILCTLYHTRVGISNDMQHSEDSDAKLVELCDTELAVCLLECEKRTCTAIQKLLAMIMELDSSKKQADIQGCTTRADGIRTSAVEIIVDELTYNKDIISPFLQVFDEPKWKLEIVLQYFFKYTAKPAVRTRKSNGSTDDATLEGILKCFSNSSGTKSVIKKISSEVAQILLGHAFQAYLSASLPSQENNGDDIVDMKEGEERSSVVHVCESFISAFLNLQKADERAEMSPFAKQALFTATTIMSTLS